MKIDSNLHRAKKAIVNILFNISQNREKKKKANQERREEKIRLKKELEFKREKASVTGPNTPASISTWSEMMGRKPTEAISEIRSQHSRFIFNSYKTSFHYRSEEELLEIMRNTHWSGLSRILDIPDDELHLYSFSSSEKIPEWPDYWPIHPAADSFVHGVPASRPFASDCYYFYLDKTNKRVFLSTNLTHLQYSNEIEHMILRQEEINSACNESSKKKY